MKGFIGFLLMIVLLVVTAGVCGAFASVTVKTFSSVCDLIHC